MKHTLLITTALIITVLMLVVGLAWGQTTNPCEDERYLKIKEKLLDEMSDREYAYFLKFDEKCTDYLESSSTYSGVKSKEPVAKPIDGNILVKKGSLMYAPDSPIYVATAKIMSTRASEKRQFIAGRIEEVQIDLEKAEQELKQFRDRNRQNQNSPSFLLEQERLSQEVEVVMGVYFTLIQEYEVARIQEVKETEVVQVLDPPVSPLEMSIPKDKLGEPYSGQAVWYYDNGQKKYERTYKDGKLIESTRWDKDGNE